MDTKASMSLLEACHKLWQTSLTFMAPP